MEDEHITCTILVVQTGLTPTAREVNYSKQQLRKK
jgi:hypothetical protein